jgi:hypothetical protein
VQEERKAFAREVAVCICFVLKKRDKDGDDVLPACKVFLQRLQESLGG